MPAMPVRNRCVSVAFHRQTFSREECEKILASVRSDTWEEAKVGGQDSASGFAEVRHVRSNRQQHLAVDPTGFPINKILAAVSEANSSGWMFHLSGLVYDDVPWIMRYDADGRGHNDWHVDIGQGANASRKLAFSVQLSEPDSYEGGDLEFFNMELDPHVLRRQGTLVAFPAYWLHRVTPVRRACRYALVGWVHGPSFQ